MRYWVMVIFLSNLLGVSQWNSQVQNIQVAQFPSYTEGVVVDHTGNLYVSYSDRISRVTSGGKVSSWASTPSPNGHKILANGTHVVCDRKGPVYLLSSDGKIIRELANPENGANDICLDPRNGGFYFTSPYASRTEPKGKIYHVDVQGNTRVISDNLGYPNGIVLRSDGSKLLVGESLYNRVLEFPVLSPGQVGPSRVFAKLPKKGKGQLDNRPDGMALDEAGNLYVAHYGMGRVQVLDPQGDLLASLVTGAVFTSNVAFGGPTRNQLYVTGSLGPIAQQSAGVLMRLDLPWVTGLEILPVVP